MILKNKKKIITLFAIKKLYFNYIDKIKAKENYFNENL